ncbi:MAG: hypothetical protein ACI4S4_02015 [Candidatus Ornithospirochaeta sp.]
MKMKSLIPVLLSVLVFSSCASYTIQEAREVISYPSTENLPPTKYSTIVGIEEEKKAALARAEEERLRKEAEERINVYPSDLSSITTPFYFNPVKNIKGSTEGDSFRVVLVPLGEEKLTDAQINAVALSISDVDATVTAITGSLSNQTRLSSLIGEDAMTLDGGTLVFKNAAVSSVSSDTLVLSLSDDKEIVFLSVDQKPLLPGEGDTEEILSLVDTLSDRDIEPLVDYISKEDGKEKILFLSSYSPSHSDWSDWSDYSYRYDRSFMIPQILEDLKWQDTYDALRFSTETQPGVTRRNGEIEERLDYIWSKGLLPQSSFTLPLETIDSTAVVAAFMIP